MINKSKFSLANWNLIITPPINGAMNMAIDEALLKSIGEKQSLPILRLYSWEPACISLGYAQKYTDVDIIRLEERGWEIVRRATGGRAILHTNELTYAVIGPSTEPRLAGDILTSYKRLSNALLETLKILNAPAIIEEQHQQSQLKNQDPICFEVPSSYEITVNGKKLIGSAQARKKEGVLQHGTLPLFGDLGRITEILAYRNEESRNRAKTRMLKRATTLESSIGKVYDFDTVGDAMKKAFEDALNIHFISREISNHERDLAEKLVAEKYGNLKWTNRG